MRKIKVGIWGLGRAGIGMHIPEILGFPDMFEIVAGCDIDAEHRKVFAEKTGAKAYSDGSGKELLADPNVELVSVATRSPDHTEHALKALKAGKYVFLEKPIALSYKDALRLKKASAKYPGKLFFRHNRRFEPAFQHIREIIDSGILGEVYEIKLNRHGYQRRADWQTIISCGGGQLNNWGPHIVDHGLRLLGAPLADVWGDLKKVAAVGDAEDHLKIVMRGKNGRIVDLEISGGTAIPEQTYIVRGSKGALTSDERNIVLRYINPKQKLMKIKADPGTPPLQGGFGNAEKLEWIDETIPVAPKLESKMENIWKHLYNAIRNGIKYPVKIDEAVEVVRVSEMVKKRSRFEAKKK